mmetsp:Transcript_13673/g.50955  ORF Transcript_13673/g.50955 Transcript_13673/m.50955 type:complete len:175 (-) Transcript_13673:607-1131(-)
MCCVWSSIPESSLKPQAPKAATEAAVGAAVAALQAVAVGMPIAPPAAKTEVLEVLEGTAEMEDQEGTEAPVGTSLSRCPGRTPTCSCSWIRCRGWEEVLVVAAVVEALADAAAEVVRGDRATLGRRRPIRQTRLAIGTQGLRTTGILAATADEMAPPVVMVPQAQTACLVWTAK